MPRASTLSAVGGNSAPRQCGLKGTSENGPSAVPAADRPAPEAVRPRPTSPEQKRKLVNLSPKQVQSAELAGEPIEQVLSRAPGNDEAIGGIKVVAKSGWFAARPSGTENIYKIYAESFRGEEHLRAILREAQAIVDAALA